METQTPDLLYLEIAQITKAKTAKELEYERLLFQLGAMKSPPCFVCGHNGFGYYNPEKHPCAKLHHVLYKHKD